MKLIWFAGRDGSPVYINRDAVIAVVPVQVAEPSTNIVVNGGLQYGVLGDCAEVVEALMAEDEEAPE